MRHSLSVGDVVRLKGSHLNPKMTVSALIYESAEKYYGATTVQAVWFALGAELRSANFPVDLLEVIPAPESDQ